MVKLCKRGTLAKNLCSKIKSFNMLVDKVFLVVLGGFFLYDF